MNKKSVGSKDAADKLVKNICPRTSRKYSAKEKMQIVLAGLRGEGWASDSAGTQKDRKPA